MTAKATKINPSKSPGRKANPAIERQPSPKRSDTVEGLLERVVQEKPISYEDVFKTRNRVVDDRATTPVPSPASKPSSALLLNNGQDQPQSRLKQRSNEADLPKSSKVILEEVDGFLNSLYQSRPSSSRTPTRMAEPDISKYSFSNTRPNTSTSLVPSATKSGKSGNRGKTVNSPTPVGNSSPSRRIVVAWNSTSGDDESIKNQPRPQISNVSSGPATPKLLNKELSAFAADPVITTPTTLPSVLGIARVKGQPASNTSISGDGPQNEFEEMLKSSSQILLLPEIEAKYLDQYHLDTAQLKQISSKVDQLSKKMKEITKFIKSKIKEEEASLTPYALKIQSWSRFYPDLQKANAAAVKIQSLWRGVYTRFHMGPTYQISLLKAIIRTQGIQMRRMAQKHERELEEIKVYLKMTPQMAVKPPVDDLTSEPYAS